jgi:hypothetical protein
VPRAKFIREKKFANLKTLKIPAQRQNKKPGFFNPGLRERLLKFSSTP